MARKRRAPSPPPPPPPPPPPQQEESSSSYESGSDDDEESPRAPAPQNPPQNPQPPSAAAHSSSSEGSDSDSDAQAFQLRQVYRSPTKPPHPAPRPESDADDDGELSESEPENPEPVVQKVKGKEKSKAEQERKRPAPEAAPSGKAKKAKAEADKAAAEATPAGKGKKAKAEAQKAAPEPTPSGKGKKAGGKEKPPALDSSAPSSKSDKPSRTVRSWSKVDETKILEALADHVKSEGALPKTDALLTAVQDHLSRKNCSYTEIYEKVRRLKERYEKALSTGSVPSREDELHMYNLSEAVWGEKAKGASAATTSQNDGAVTKSKKGHANKEKMNGNSKDGAPKEATTITSNQNGDSQKAVKKAHAIKGKTEGDVKSRLSKEATVTASPSKSYKQGHHKEEAATTATQNGGALAKSRRGKADKERMEIDTEILMPKEVTTATQNGGTPTKSKKGETHDEEIETDNNAQGMPRSFDELQNLYSNLAACVEDIVAEHPCGETLKRAFKSIDDEKAKTLENKIKKQRVAEVKMQMRRADIKKDVLNMMLSLVD